MWFMALFSWMVERLSLVGCGSSEETIAGSDGADSKQESAGLKVMRRFLVSVHSKSIQSASGSEFISIVDGSPAV